MKCEEDGVVRYRLYRKLAGVPHYLELRFSKGLPRDYVALELRRARRRLRDHTELVRSEADNDPSK